MPSSLVTSILGIDSELKREGPGRSFETRTRVSTPRCRDYTSKGLCLRSFVLGLDSNRDDWIRTSDLFHPKEARYQAAPRPVHIEAYASSNSTFDASIRV